MDPKQARKTVAMVRLGLGAMWLTPGLGARLFGLDPNAQPALRVLARLFAARDAMMAAALLEAGEDEADRQLRYGIAVDAADFLALAAAVMRKQIPARTFLLGASTAAAVLALGVVARDEAPSA